MPYNKKQKKWTMDYLNKLKEIRFRVNPEDYENFKEAAQAAGYKSMRQFYIDALKEKVKKINGGGNGNGKI